MNLARLRQLDLFALTLLVSVLLHAGMIFGIKFEPPDLSVFKDHMSALEIVLVNAKTATAPQKADVLAQANLDRGGNTEEDRQAKSALPAPVEKPQETVPKPVEQRPEQVQQKTPRPVSDETKAERQQQRVAELEQQARELMVQAKQSDQQLASQEEVPVSKTEQDDRAAAPVLDRATLSSAIKDMARLEAQIAKQSDEYQKRPKRKFIGARVQEYRFATYIESWRQKVERVGNLNYPQAAKEQKLYGQLMMTVSIKADGTIEKIELNRSSGYAVLDDAARRIVELAAPYSPFPENIRQDTDILVITRTWSFTRQDSFAND